MEALDRIIEDKRRQFGDKFDSSGLAPEFARYLHTGQRIQVKGPYATRFGTVGITTGWKPAFLLMSRSSAHGSSDVLGPEDIIIAVQVGRKYLPIAGRRA